MSPDAILAELLAAVARADAALRETNQGRAIASIHGASAELLAAARAVPGAREVVRRNEDGTEEWTMVDVHSSSAWVTLHGERRRTDARSWKERAEDAERRLAEIKAEVPR